MYLGTHNVAVNRRHGWDVVRHHRAGNRAKGLLVHVIIFEHIFQQCQVLTQNSRAIVLPHNTRTVAVRLAVV